MTIEELKPRFISYAAERYTHHLNPCRARDFIKAEAAKAGIKLEREPVWRWEQQLELHLGYYKVPEMIGTGLLRHYDIDLYYMRSDGEWTKDKFDRFMARAKALLEDPFLYDPDFVPRKPELTMPEFGLF